MNYWKANRLGKLDIFLIIIVLVVSGCSPAPILQTEQFYPAATVQSTPFINTKTAPPAANEIAPSKSAKVIRVGTGDSGNELNSHQMVIQSYEENHSDVLIQMEAIAGTDYYARLMTLAEAKRAPDVINVGDDYVRFFVDKGMYTPLDEIKRNTAFDASDFLPGLLEPGQVNGRQYFLPMNYSTLALYYNKKLFDEAGVPYPTENWKWNDLLSAARKLTLDSNKDGIPEQWGIQMNANWENGFEFWVASAGGRLISEDGKKVVGYMDSPEAIRALKFYADLYHKYRVAPPPVDLQAWAGGNREFEDGTAAMVIFGRWTQSAYLMNPKIDFGITSPPMDKVKTNILFWDGCGISSSSENPSQALDFLDYYHGAGSSKIWGDERLPVVKAALNEPSQMLELIDNVWINELNNLSPRAYSYTPYWEETARYPLKDALTTVIMDPKADPARVLKTAARDAQAALDSYQ
jgi:multiple sugar transport system substrate-binding protein